MRTGAAFFAGAGSAAIIALGWSMGAQAIAASTHSTSTATSTAASGSGSTSSASPSASASSSSGGSSASSGSSSSNSSSSNGSSSSSSSSKSGTFTGSAVYEPQFGGTVQVSVTIANGKITAATTPTCTATHGREQACPMLNQEAVSAQSRNISAIGGATYTSNAYIQSYQEALDKAGFTA